MFCVIIYTLHAHAKECEKVNGMHKRYISGTVSGKVIALVIQNTYIHAMFDMYLLRSFFFLY